MIGFRDKVGEAADSIKKYLECEPVAGLVLGTGLGGIVDEMEKTVVVPYSAIPHWPVCTAPGHHGQLVCGRWAGKPVIAHGRPFSSLRRLFASGDFISDPGPSGTRNKNARAFECGRRA